MITATDETFDKEVLQSDIPVLVDFWATWYGPCKALMPTIQDIADETRGTAKVVKANIEDAPDVASRLGIMGVPTLMIFKGGKCMAGFAGAQSKKKILEELL